MIEITENTAECCSAQVCCKSGMEIVNVVGREILDSRGNPTVEAEVTLADGSMGRGTAPSGASTGEFEALELRDGDEKRYRGKGVQRAVDNINTSIRAALLGRNAADIYAVDHAMLAADGTKDKSRLGANAVLAVSIASAKAAAVSLGIPLYRFLGGIAGKKMPVPMMNILNGGAHVAKAGEGGLDTQEFMIMPVGARSMKEAVRMCVEVYHKLGENLKRDGFSTAVGDEGGFAPALSSDEEAIKYILRAIHDAGYSAGTKVEAFGEHYNCTREEIGTDISKDAGKVEGVSRGDFVIAMDAAASEWKSEKGKGHYQLPKVGINYTTDELIAHWKELVEKYPIASIEDPLDEEDWEGWQKITAQLGGKIQLVGDDLFVTNTERLSRGIESRCGNSILIKVNQIGTLSETIEAIQMAHCAGYTSIASHRSGETEDTTIADLAVALNTGQIKTGAPCRGERTAKYNQLLRIEEELGNAACYQNPFEK